MEEKMSLELYDELKTAYRRPKELRRRCSARKYRYNEDYSYFQDMG